MKSAFTVKAQNYETNKIAEDLRRTLGPLASNPFLNGQVLENISLSASTTNVIEHKLDRPLRFWTIVRGPILSATYTTNDAEWTQYTPTITHFSGGITNATHAVYYKTIGDSILLRGKTTFSAASAAFTGLTFSLPNSWSRNSKDSNFNEIGTARFFDAGATGWSGYVTQANSTTVSLGLNAIFTHVGTVYVGDAPITNTAPFTFNTSDTITWYTRPIPITQLSNLTTKNIWEVTGEFNEKYLYLKSTVDCTVSLYVG